MNNNLTDRVFFYAFVAAAPFLLFANVLSFDAKNAIGGIGTNLFFYCLVLLFAISLLRRKTRDLGLFVLILIIGFVVVKNVFYREGGTEVGTALLMVRNYAIFAVYYFLGRIYLRTEQDRQKVLGIIAKIVIVAAVIGILHYHFFYWIPFIDLKYATDEYGGVLFLKDPSIMRFRETSLFFGPNVFAYMLVFGYVCYYHRWKTPESVNSQRARLNMAVVAVLIAYALVVTDSRSALFLHFIFILVNIMKGRIGIWARLLISLSIMAIAGALLMYSERFSIALALSDPRFAKMFMAYTLLAKSWVNWVVGIPSGSAWGDGDLFFSDNLYGALLLEGGLTLILLLAAFVRAVLNKIKRNEISASASDSRYLEAVRYSLIFFMLYGLFAIPTSMVTLFNYLGLLMGGATRIYGTQREGGRS